MTHDRSFVTREMWIDFLKAHAAAIGATEWPGRPPATDEQIENAEQRLGVEFPPSYRSFIQATNGWTHAARSIPILRPIETVQPFRKLHREWIDAYQFSEPVDLPEPEYFDYANCDPVQFDPKHLKHTLCVSEIGDDAVILLNPMVVWPDGEWETWFFANWLPGAMRFRSFSEWFRHAHAEVSAEVFTHEQTPHELPTVYLDPPAKPVRRIRRREKIYDLKTVLKQLKSPNATTRRTAAKRMGRIRSPESFAALRQLLQTEEDHYVRMEIVDSIGRIGGDDALEFLKPYVDHAELGSEALHAIARIRSESATEFLLKLLAEGHQHAPSYVLSQRGEVRAIPLMVTLLTASEFQAHRHRPYWGQEIACFGNAEALEALRPLVSHPDIVVRRSAYNGLTLIAFNTAKQVPVKAESREVLERCLLTEPDAQLRALLQTSLEITRKGGVQIDPSPFT
jgi:hypothetical protein